VPHAAGGGKGQHVSGRARGGRRRAGFLHSVLAGAGPAGRSALPGPAGARGAVWAALWTRTSEMRTLLPAPLLCGPGMTACVIL
jgi:hypothetical protein